MFNVNGLSLKDITERFTAPEQEQTQLKSHSIRQD